MLWKRRIVAIFEITRRINGLWAFMGAKSAKKATFVAREEKEGNPQRHEKSRPIPEQALSAGN
jgi:hypothetical protein